MVDASDSASVRRNTNWLVVVFVQHHPLKVQVESVSLFGLDQPVAAQVVPAAVVADGRWCRRQYPANRCVTNPSSAGHGWTHVITRPDSLLSWPPAPVTPNPAAVLTLTDTLWFRGAPVRLSGVDAGRHLVATHLEAWVAVEVGLTSRVDVRHRHAALVGGARERAGQQEGCVKRAKREIWQDQLYRKIFFNLRSMYVGKI